MLKRRHRHLTGVFDALDGNGADQSFKREFDEALVVLEHPFGAGQGWESSGRKNSVAKTEKISEILRR